MPPSTRRPSPRRTDALSRERIVAAAVALLDTTGEGGLTFRALAERLTTGPGAIYHHVANKDELLAAAAESVVVDALAAGSAAGDGPAGGSPHDGVRAVALGLFDAIDDHPWLAAQLGAQLSRRPWTSTTPRILESLGRHVRALGAPRSTWFTTATALMSYILGAAGQNAANARAHGPEVDRGAFLDRAATAWEELDPEDYPFVRAVADQLRDHDDREQFLAGIDLVLGGVTGGSPAVPNV